MMNATPKCIALCNHIPARLARRITGFVAGCFVILA